LVQQLGPNNLDVARRSDADAHLVVARRGNRSRSLSQARGRLPMMADSRKRPELPSDRCV
jgi:hypothetical protein